MTAQGKAALLELRDRLGKATGPSFELDDALWSMQTGLAAYTEGEPFKAGNSPRRTRLSIPKFTASLDAAVTLVPEGMLIENLGEMRDSGPWTGHWLAQFSPRGPRPRLAPGPITAATVRAACDGLPTVRAATPALALCLARIEFEIANAEQGK